MEIDLEQIDKSNEWFTENTYDKNYKKTPNNHGVYILVAIDFEPLKREVIYVGSSKCLRKRYNNHEVIRNASKKHDFIKFYFKECNDFLEVEKKLIKELQPKLNTQWR